MGDVVTLRNAARLADSGCLWSISALADAFGMSRHTVKKRLASCAPDGEHKGNPVWLIGTAVPCLFGSTEKREQLDDFSPKDRRDWVASERDLLKLRQEAGELISVTDHREQLVSMARAIVTHLDTLADVLEREAGLTPDQIEATTEACDRIRAQMYADVSA